MSHIRPITGRISLATLAGAAGAALALAAVGSSAAATRPAAKPMLEVVSVHGFGKVVADSKGLSLYGLSSEAGGKLKCTGGCLKFWPPVLVPASTKTFAAGAGISGKIGFVKRSAATKQVTLNGYPLYTFSGDKGRAQSHGEGIAAFGGVWELVDPAAKSPSATLVAKAKVASSSKSSGSTW